MLSEDDFVPFFAALHGGHEPFEWQKRLLRTVLEKGRWPEQISAPTGAGKTAVIDVHVFAQALTAGCDDVRPPRRLAMVVNRRVLVDDQYQHAVTVANALVEPDEDVLAAVRERLWSMRTDRGGGSPLVLARLRGGSPPSRSWRDHPGAAAVLCATPDMWGSRLLFRGYGSSPRAWPREAGLLAFDAVVVVDEAHLSRQLLCTARRVGELAAVAEEPLSAAPVQVVETTATPPDDGPYRSAGVLESDLVDPELAARLCRPKPVTLVPVANWTSATSRAPVTALRDEVVALAKASGGTVGCFVNTVARAIAVTDQLRASTVGGRDLRVVLICGQTRPIDVERLRARYPGLLAPDGSDEVDVLVSTQSLEVGVDLDLAGMVTELADGSALAQRAGRVNRRGRRASGPITVTVPDGDITDRTRSGPYGADALRAAHEWMSARAATAEGLSPWSLRSHRPPRPDPRRMLHQRPELGQGWHWARTSDVLAAEPDLALWLSEDLDDDASIGLVVRADLPQDSGEAVALVRALPPRRHETFPIPLVTARRVLLDLPPGLPAVVVRGDDVDPLVPPAERDAPAPPRLRPGDTVVVHASAALFTSDRSGPPVPVPADAESVPRYPADDVLEAEAELDGWADREGGRVVHRIELGDDSELRTSLDDSPATEHRAIISAWLADRSAPRPMRRSATALLRHGRLRDADVIVQTGQDGPQRVLIVDRRRVAADEVVRQVWTPHGNDEVLLDEHQDAVAARAAELAHAVGLDSLAGALAEAGRHHDDGKRDPRFQHLLGATSDVLWAKSRSDTTAAQIRRSARESGLPASWRHEQRSVVECRPVIDGDPRAELIARLVGTSHGHGRSGFPHSAAELMPPSEIAEDLFDLGGWDELIERTQLRYGVWGCAYLEALLRAADGQVSGEGR